MDAITEPSPVQMPSRNVNHEGMANATIAPGVVNTNDKGWKQSICSSKSAGTNSERIAPCSKMPMPPRRHHGTSRLTEALASSSGPGAGCGNLLKPLSKAAMLSVRGPTRRLDGDRTGSSTTNSERTSQGLKTNSA